MKDGEKIAVAKTVFGIGNEGIDSEDPKLEI